MMKYKIGALLKSVGYSIVLMFYFRSLERIDSDPGINTAMIEALLKKKLEDPQKYTRLITTQKLALANIPCLIIVDLQEPSFFSSLLCCSVIRML